MVSYKKREVSNPNTCVIMLKDRTKVSIIKYRTNVLQNTGDFCTTVFCLKC